MEFQLFDRELNAAMAPRESRVVLPLMNYLNSIIELRAFELGTVRFESFLRRSTEGAVSPRQTMQHNPKLH